VTDEMLVEYLPKLVQNLYMEVKKAQAPVEEEKPIKAKKGKKAKEKKVNKPAKGEKKEKPVSNETQAGFLTLIVQKDNVTEKKIIDRLAERFFGGDKAKAQVRYKSHKRYLTKEKGWKIEEDQETKILTTIVKSD